MNARTDIRPMGLVKGLSMEEYHAIDALSATGLRHLMRSPWHYANRVDVKETRAMLNGSLVHCARLEPEALAQRYVVVPEDAPRRPTDAQWAAKKSNESSQAAKEWWAALDRGDRRPDHHPGQGLRHHAAAARRGGARPRDRRSDVGRLQRGLGFLDRPGDRCVLQGAAGLRALDDGRRADRPEKHRRRVAERLRPRGARMGYQLQAAHYSAGWRGRDRPRRCTTSSSAP
jgi:hypothetical protein